MTTKLSLFALFTTGLLITGACSGSERGDTAGDDSSGDDGGGGSDGGVVPTGCRELGAADRTRYMVVAHPFGVQPPGGAAPGAKVFEVLTVSETGDATRFSPPKTFELTGRANYGSITFTPNGKIGIVVLTEIFSQGIMGGTLGVFTLADDGTPTVVHAAFEGPFFAAQVVMDPTGERAYVIDRQWRNNGGGIYQVNIGCDGQLTDGGLIVASKLPGGLIVDGDRALLNAVDVGPDETPGKEMHMLSWGGATPTVTTGIDTYAEDTFGFGGAALTKDKKTYLVGDNGLNANSNRVTAVNVGDGTLSKNAEIPGINDPQSIVASPFSNLAVVTAVQGNNIYILEPSSEGGIWAKRGPVAYAGAGPKLPADITMVSRGSLTGHMWVAENTSIRHMKFTMDRNVADMGTAIEFSTSDDDTAAITGAIGIQP